MRLGAIRSGFGAINLSSELAFDKGGGVLSRGTTAILIHLLARNLAYNRTNSIRGQCEFPIFFAILGEITVRTVGCS